MPRILLTPEEAAHIEKLRAKNAKVIGFNEGIATVLAYLESFQTLEDSTPESVLMSLQLQIAELKKPELIP